MNQEDYGMRDLLQTIVKPLVNHPDAIRINPINRGRTIVLELTVDPSDMGKVIGRGGRRAKAIRAVMKARATLQGKRVVVDIVD